MNKSEFVLTAASIIETKNLANILGCKASVFPFEYLGMSLAVKKLSKACYLSLIQKIGNRLSKWKASMLSIGGRLILINATLSAMPIYIMSTFLLPKWVIKKIDQIRCKFLWHGHKDQTQTKYMSLASWSLVTRTKMQSRLGVKDLSIMNKALVAKTMWHWNQINKPWWMAIVPTDNTVLKPWELNTTTPLWKDMKQIEGFFSISITYKLGGGTHIRFWDDA